MNFSPQELEQDPADKWAKAQSFADYWYGNILAARDAHYAGTVLLCLSSAGFYGYVKEGEFTNGPFELIYYSPAGNQRASQLDPKLLEQALREGPGKTSMPIIGVVSMSPDEALRPYKDKQHYNEWEFIAGEQQQQEEGDEETDTDDEDEEEPEGF